MNTKILILGGSGFIGSHLVDLLIGSYKTKVFVYDINEPHREDVGWLKGDITDFKQLEKAVDTVKPACIFHCAGLLGTAETFNCIDRAISINIGGMVNVLEVARKFKKPIVYLGLTNNWLNPYTITKRAAAKFCKMYAETYGVKVAVIKALNAYGERQAYGKGHPAKIGPQFIVNAIKNKPLVINGSGVQVVDLVYAGDIAHVMTRAASWLNYLSKTDDPYLECDAGTGMPMTVCEVAETIIELTKSKSKIKYIPMRNGEPENSVTIANPAIMRQVLGYYPHTSFEEGMKKTIEYYRSKYA